jgi:hypothetical protein
MPPGIEDSSGIKIGATRTDPENAMVSLFIINFLNVSDIILGVHVFPT